MDIKSTYQELLQSDLSIKNVNKINDLKKQCRRQNNQEYYFLSNLLLIDIYIDETMYDEALKLATTDLNNIDSNIFKNIYLYLLERIIYIYIQKGNYKSAYKYVYIKRNVIDLENKEEVNRWYLEMSYVYAELNELNRALMSLQAILENYPTEEIKNIALSNMTKIYIDQGMIKEAKEYLNQSLEQVIKINDEDGKIYCDYLLAKIYVLENNFPYAKKIYEDLFKNQNQLPLEYLNLVNEYISLLINMNELNEAEEVINNYEVAFQNANIYIQKEFYRNKVKVASFKNSNIRDELQQILEMIDILDSEIASSKELVLSEAAEEEKNEEIQQSLKSTINKLEQTIDIITYALNHDDARASLMNFSKRLEEIIIYDEASYVIFEAKQNEYMPNFFDNLSEFSSYQYKKDRLYERNHPYQSLTNTPIELVIQNTNELIINFTDTNIPLKNLITNRNYDANEVTSLIAIPLFHNQELFGVAVFSAKNDLTSNENILVLKIASKLLEFKLSSLFYQENLRSQRNILQTAISRLQEGLFYYDPKGDKILLTQKFQNFLKIDKRILNLQQYLELIHPDEQQLYLSNLRNAVNLGEGYDIKYRININDEILYLHEIANPYFLTDGTLSFFVGTINKLPLIFNEVGDTNLLSSQEFNDKLIEITEKVTNLEYKFSLIRIKINNSNQYNLPLNKILTHLGSVVLINFESQDANLYYLDDHTLIFELSNCNDQRIIDRCIKASKRSLKKIVIENEEYSFDVDFAVARYPRDSINITKIFEITDLILSVNDGSIYYSEALQQRYAFINSLNHCIKEQLQEEIILLYQPLEKNNKINSYEVKYNVKGINVSKYFRTHIDKDLLIQFDKKVLQKLYLDLQENFQDVFVLISPYSIETLLEQNKLKTHPLNKNITIIFDIYYPNEQELISLIENLTNIEFKVGFTYGNMVKYSLDFIKKYVPTLMLISDEEQIMQDNEALFQSLNLKVISSKVITRQLKNIVFRVEDIIPAERLNRK